MYLTRAAVKASLDAMHELSGDGTQIAHDMWFLVDDPGIGDRIWWEKNARLDPAAFERLQEDVRAYHLVTAP